MRSRIAHVPQTLIDGIRGTLVLGVACVMVGALVSAETDKDRANAGALSVSSDPLGAAVYLDGQFAGETPVNLPALSTGDHRVRLVKDGYLEHSRVVKIGGSKSATLQVRLMVRPAPGAARQAGGLKIVVIAGEDAVNIIQQKTAVAPVVEVRDRNDQPVAGAVVRFAIQGGRATFNGARTLTVTTNVAGRAAVSGLTPTASGAFQISASAAFQGQTAAVTIAQTNVLTAAQAASAAGAGGTGGGAGAGAGGASGASGGSAAGGAAAATGGGGVGLSATTIGLVGAAVGGGALAAMQLSGDKAGGGTKYTGTYSGQLVQILGSGSPPGGCTNTSALTGTLDIQLETATGGAVSGTAQVDHHNADIANFCLGYLQAPYSFRTPPSPVAGATGNLGFSYASSGTYVNPSGSGATGTFTHAFTFSGALNENAITGVLTITYTNQPSGGPGSGPGGGGSTLLPITLR